MLTNGEIAAAMAENMSQAAVPLYGKKLHLPDRNSIIAVSYTHLTLPTNSRV